MNSTTDSVPRILDLEARQDEALRQLAELEHRIDALLAEFLPPGAAPQSAAPPAPAEAL